MMESGLRGRYAYSGPDPYPHDKAIDFDDVLRAKRRSSPLGRSDRSRIWAAAFDAAGSPPLTAYPQEFRFALDNGLPIILHSGSRPGVMTPGQAPCRGLQQEHDLCSLADVRPKDREVMAENGNL